jgi:cobalt-zinc-cadmium efflux system membrane fusion protein
VKRAPLMLGLLGLAACRRAPPPPPPATEAAPRNEVELSAEALATAKVEWRRVEPGTFAPRLRIATNIASDPQHLAQVGARVTGRITAVPVQLGQRIRRGQPLLEVDTVELHQVTLEYLTAVARLRAANDALGRQKQLVAERVGAEADLRRAETDHAAAEATLKEAEEHLHFLGLGDKSIARLGKETTHGDSRSVVPSPIDGRVVALRVTLGQVLTGSEDVVTVADVDTVWASLRTYERDLGNVTVGTPVEIRVTAFPERPFNGQIAFVSDLVDPASRSGEARAPLANPDGALRPGMSGVAYVPYRAAPTERWLPADAVQPHDGATVVFVHTAGRRFVARAVRTGEDRGGFVPLLDGVKPEDEVVVQGAFALRGELERPASGD